MTGGIRISLAVLAIVLSASIIATSAQWTKGMYRRAKESEFKKRRPFIWILTFVMMCEDSWWLVDGGNAKNQVGRYSLNAYPGARAGAVSGYTLSEGKATLWLFGGFGAAFFEAKGYLSDLWRFNTQQQRYENRVYAARTSLMIPSIYGAYGDFNRGSWPGGRAFSSTFTDTSGRMWIYGGEGVSWAPERSGLLDDVFVFDASLPSSTPAPSSSQTPSQDSSATLNVGRFAFMFGSQGTFATPNISSQNASLATPGGRSRMAYDTWSPGLAGRATSGGSKGVVFGGYIYANYTSSNDVWVLDFATTTWENYFQGCQNASWGDLGVENVDNCPPRLVGSSAVIVNDYFYVFGGYSDNKTGTYLSNAVWRFNLNSKMWAWISGSSAFNEPGIYSSSPLSPRSPPPTGVDPLEPPEADKKRENSKSSEISSSSSSNANVNIVSSLQRDVENIKEYEELQQAPDTPEEFSPDSPSSGPDSPSSSPSSPVETPGQAPNSPEEPSGEPVEEPNSETPNSPSASAPDAPSSSPQAPSSPSTPSTPSSNSVLVPGSRYGAVLQYSASTSLVYYGFGVGVDAYGDAGNLNDFWTFNLATNEWKVVSGEIFANQDSDYRFGTTSPNGRLFAHSWVDEYENILVGSGFWQRQISVFRNDLWSFAVREPSPSAPEQFTPIKPLPYYPPSAPSPFVLEPELETFNFYSNENCGTKQPSSAFICVDYARWASPTSFTPPSGTWEVLDNVQIDIYGDFTLGSESVLAIETGSSIGVRGRANLFGNVMLRVDFESAKELAKKNSKAQKTFLLIEHREPSQSGSKRSELKDNHNRYISSSDTNTSNLLKKVKINDIVIYSNEMDVSSSKRSKSKEEGFTCVSSSDTDTSIDAKKGYIGNFLEGIKSLFISPREASSSSSNTIHSKEGVKHHISSSEKDTYTEARKRDINNPIKKGKGRVTGSECSTVSYDVNDEYYYQDIYRVYAHVKSVNMDCRNRWWIVLLIVLGALLLAIIIAVVLLNVCYKKPIFGWSNMDEGPALPGSSGNDSEFNPASVADMDEHDSYSSHEMHGDIDISDDAESSNDGLFAKKVSGKPNFGESDEDEVSSEQEGSEEDSEENDDDSDSYVESEEQSEE